jgi:hypothetical protein
MQDTITIQIYILHPSIIWQSSSIFGDDSKKSKLHSQRNESRLNSGDILHHSVQNFCVKIEVYEIIISTVVLYKCET